MSSKRSIVLATVAIVAIATLSIVVLVHVHADARAASTGLPTGSIESRTQYWEDRIRAIGPANAYNELAQDLANADPGTAHGNAHIFGAALYSVEGLSGVTTCDMRFSSGCFHQFIGSAIADKGMSVVSQLDQDCAKSNSGCQHGIGHGLISYLGYTEDDLKKAVAVCESLPDHAKLDGCFGGAFMEYNMRTMISLDESAVRSATSTKDLLSPCDQFSGGAELSCLLYQPQWWWVSLGPKDFARMVDLCDTLSPDARNICMVGVGEMAPPDASYDATSTAQLCESQAKSASDRFYCVTGAGVVFAGTGTPEKEKAVCETLSDPAQTDRCMSDVSGNSLLTDI